MLSDEEKEQKRAFVEILPVPLLPDDKFVGALLPDIVFVHIALGGDMHLRLALSGTVSDLAGNRLLRGTTNLLATCLCRHR